MPTNVRSKKESREPQSCKKSLAFNRMVPADLRSVVGMRPNRLGYLISLGYSVSIISRYILISCQNTAHTSLPSFHCFFLLVPETPYLLDEPAIAC